ncbi:hypothetical protein SDC9_202239 [bioreactor metagenome]|uniref:Uncharacterized protein n=1 Tax=bioreactor metagenome TaxID=1076179 RepID=A0A645IT59_9ZZZZ
MVRQGRIRCAPKALLQHLQQITLRKELGAAAEDGGHRIIFGHNHHILPKGAVKLIPHGIDPNLIAIAQLAFAVWRGNLLAGGLLYPFRTENPFAFPHAVLQV